jgi:hypothetical protein
MRHSSPFLFAPSDTRTRDGAEVVTGRFGEADVAVQFTEARLRTASRSVRQDDRPAGRMTMTLLPAE